MTAFYYGLGFDEQDLDRAQVGIGTPLLDGNLCNLHAYELARQLAEGCKEVGLIGFWKHVLFGKTRRKPS